MTAVPAEPQIYRVAYIPHAHHVMIFTNDRFAWRWPMPGVVTGDATVLDTDHEYADPRIADAAAREYSLANRCIAWVYAIYAPNVHGELQWYRDGERIGVGLVNRLARAIPRVPPEE